MKNIMIDKLSGESDFKPLFCGEEACLPSHSFGPFVRDYCIIHFCLSGKGILRDKNGEHEVKAGELFIIKKGETTTYTADKDSPWHYIWIATLGRRAEELEDSPTVQKCSADLLGRMSRAIAEEQTRPYIYCAFLYEILHAATEGIERAEPADKLSAVRRCVKYNYMLNITVESLSKQFGFERSYLYRLFKGKYGIGVKEYIIKVRMEKAAELLAGGSPVNLTAELVGYSDEFAFSKAFKKHHGMSPLVYKKRHKDYENAQ